MKKILFILLALSFTLTSCKKDDEPEECTCTIRALDENDEFYNYPNYPMDCETGNAITGLDILPEGHFNGGCIN